MDPSGVSYCAEDWWLAFHIESRFWRVDGSNDEDIGKGSMPVVEVGYGEPASFPADVLFFRLLIKRAVATRTSKAITPIRAPIMALVDDDVDDDPDEDAAAASVLEDASLDIVPEPMAAVVDADPIPREVAPLLLNVDIRVPVAVPFPDTTLVPVVIAPASVVVPIAPVPPTVTAGAEPS
jgi:hypothetical protein